MIRGKQTLLRAMVAMISTSTRIPPLGAGELVTGGEQRGRKLLHGMEELGLEV